MNEADNDRYLCLQRVYWRLETISSLLWSSKDSLSEETYTELARSISAISEKVRKELGWKKA